MTTNDIFSRHDELVLRKTYKNIETKLDDLIQAVEKLDTTLDKLVDILGKENSYDQDR